MGIWGALLSGAEGMSLQVASASTSKFAAKKVSADACGRTKKMIKETEEGSGGGEMSGEREGER